MFDFRRITIFCLGLRLSKHKMTISFKNLWGSWPPPGYVYGPGCLGLITKNRVKSLWFLKW